MAPSSRLAQASVWGGAGDIVSCSGKREAGRGGWTGGDSDDRNAHLNMNKNDGQILTGLFLQG